MAGACQVQCHIFNVEQKHSCQVFLNVSHHGRGCEIQEQPHSATIGSTRILSEAESGTVRADGFDRGSVHDEAGFGASHGGRVADW